MISLLHGRGGWGRKGRERERERYRWKSVVKENNTVIINIVPSVRRLVRRSLRNVQGGCIKYCKSDDSFVITLAVTRSFSVWRHRVPSSVSFLSLIFLAPVKSRLHTHVYTRIHTHRIVSLLFRLFQRFADVWATPWDWTWVYISLPSLSSSLSSFQIKFQNFFHFYFFLVLIVEPFSLSLSIISKSISLVEAISNRSKWILD